MLGDASSVVTMSNSTPRVLVTVWTVPSPRAKTPSAAATPARVAAAGSMKELDGALSALAANELHRRRRSGGRLVRVMPNTPSGGSATGGDGGARILAPRLCLCGRDG